LDLRDAVEVSFPGFAILLFEKILAVFCQRGIFRIARNRHDFAIDFDSQIAERSIETFGSAFGILRIDVALPQIGGLENMHVGVHCFKSVFSHCLFSPNFV